MALTEKIHFSQALEFTKGSKPDRFREWSSTQVRLPDGWRLLSDTLLAVPTTGFQSQDSRLISKLFRFS